MALGIRGAAALYAALALLVFAPASPAQGGGDVSRQILHSVCAPFMRSPNGGWYTLRIFPIRDLIRSCVSPWNSRGGVVNYC